MNKAKNSNVIALAFERYICISFCREDQCGNRNIFHLIVPGYSAKEVSKRIIELNSDPFHVCPYDFSFAIGTINFNGKECITYDSDGDICENETGSFNFEAEDAELYARIEKYNDDFAHFCACSISQ